NVPLGERDMRRPDAIWRVVVCIALACVADRVPDGLVDNGELPRAGDCKVEHGSRSGEDAKTGGLDGEGRSCARELPQCCIELVAVVVLCTVVGDVRPGHQLSQAPDAELPLQLIPDGADTLLVLVVKQ